MAARNCYEFECPQYVNFIADVENSPMDTTGFWSSTKSPEILNDDVKFKIPNSKKAPNVTPIFKKCSVVKPSNITDSVKLTTQKMLSKRFSKSDGALNTVVNLKQTVKKKLNYNIGHKRSLSENDLRQKKKIQPTTPMCLKRTINNVKAKKFKTTEELELEKIAQLRKQTFDHLRANENTMRRQKLKQASNLQKDSVAQAMKVKKVPVKTFHQDHKLLQDKVKDYTRNTRPQIQKEVGAVKKPSTLHVETLKKISNLKKPSSNRFQDFLNPMGANRISVTTFEKEGISAVMKDLNIKKSDAHCGLSFSVSQRKTAIKPFNFQDRIHNLSSTSKWESVLKPKAQAASVLQTPRLNWKNKENISTVRTSHAKAKSGRQEMEKKTEMRGFRY